MANSNAVIKSSLSVDGITVTRSASIGADGVVKKGKAGDTALAAAKEGALTTRTSDTVGELTMDPSHGITTGARLDIFWDVGGVKGARYGVTVGTVATNAVPFSLGAGDNLPVDESDITAFVPDEEELLFTGNNAKFAFAKSNKRGIIVFTTSADAVVKAVVTELEGDSGGGWVWDEDNGVTNPFAASSVAKVFFSNGDSSGTNTMLAGAGVD